MKVDALSKYYSDEQLNQVINVKSKNRITIGYCRISNHKQKDDLERQIDNVRIYLQAKGQPFEIISDIGSGINYKENKLQYAVHQDLLITGFWPAKKRTMKKVADSFQIQNSESKEIRKTETQITA